jgi:hypothetical protein
MPLLESFMKESTWDYKPSKGPRRPFLHTYTTSQQPPAAAPEHVLKI